MKAKTLSLILLLALVFTGCGTTMRVASDYNESIDFARYQTFAWMTPPRAINDPLVDYPAIALRIERAIEDQLEAKGFSKVDDEPDFYVVFHAALRQQITRTYIDRWGYGYPHFPRWGPRRGGVFVDIYDVGTLVIDIVDAQADELVWRGTATDVVSNDPQQVRKQIHMAVQEILALFPSPGDRVIAKSS